MALSYVYEVTKGPIAQAKAEKQLRAIKSVVQDFTNDPSKESFKCLKDSPLDLTCFPAKKEGALVTMAVKTFTKLGFSGLITMMVGFLPDGTIHNIKVLEQRETPGLGTKIESKKFIGQFIGKHPSQNKLKVKKDGGEIDGITAATISSRAFCDGVNRAWLHFEQLQGERNEPVE